MKVIGNDIRERRAEHRKRRCEHHARAIAFNGADRLEQRARRVEIDAVALVEIGLGFARDDGREVEDHVGLFRDQLVHSAAFAEIARQAFGRDVRAGGFGRRNDIDKRQSGEFFSGKRTVQDDAIGQFAADHTGCSKY